MVAGGCAWCWWGVCVVVGGMHGWGACVVGGMHGCEGHVWLQGACVAAGGICGCGGGVCMGYDEIRSMSGQYASYWNAFLFVFYFFMNQVSVLISKQILKSSFIISMFSLPLLAKKNLISN